MHVILEENCKNILWTTNNYLCEWFWKTEIPRVEDWNCIFISPLHKKKEKRNKNLNGKLDPIKLLQENVGKTLQDIIASNYFLNMTPFADEIINGAGSELKVVFTAKQPAQWNESLKSKGKALPSVTLTLMPRMHKELKN